MHRYKDTYVRQQLKGNHESHRKEGLSVLTGFLLFLDFLLGKTISVFFFFFLSATNTIFQCRGKECVYMHKTNWFFQCILCLLFH